MAWSNDDLDEREFPDDLGDYDDADDADDETLTRECVRCGADVYEDVDQCPLCGAWITADTSPWSGRAWWWVALGILGVIGLITVLAFGAW